ncbi:MAG: nuclear transport factor 2 family protein [Actinomycetota bacterium]|nr:nuclear transport factor 2 family protein [Actinomycetota bacterium]
MRRSKRRRMASLDAMDVATRFVNAANQHDPDSLVACVHRDFQSIQPVHPDRNFRGVGQLRNNWEAIFRTEPGFRLTVLRATATDDTVWMELHGAGDDEEAAGTFILGVEDGRIRWVRVYSDIVQAPPEIQVEPPEPALAAVPDPAAPDPEPNPPWDAVVAEDTPADPLAEAEEEPVVADGEEAVQISDEKPAPVARRSWRDRLRGKAKTE